MHLAPCRIPPVGIQPLATCPPGLAQRLARPVLPEDVRHRAISFGQEMEICAAVEQRQAETIS